MTNLFNGLQVVSGEVKVETLREGFGLEVTGAFKISKGNFEQTFSYFARMYETHYKGYIGIEDGNVDTEKCNIGGLPIDSLEQLKKTLSESGLKTLSDSLGFTFEERDNAMYATVQKHKDFIKCYGKKAIVWNLLSAEEQRIVRVQHVIENYDTLNDQYKCNLGVMYPSLIKLDDDGNPIKGYVPTLEELKELLESLV